MINKYLIEPFIIDGLGGEKVKITPIEDISVSYILKIENRQQSIGDYIYQHILKELGYFYLKTDLLEINNKIYGVVEYLKGLRPVDRSNIYHLSYDHQMLYFQISTLYRIFCGMDHTEMFFMENGDMCFLDFGETCLDTFEFTLNIEILLESAIANAIAYFESEQFNIETVRTALKDLKTRFSKLDERKCCCELPDPYNYCKIIEYVKNKFMECDIEKLQIDENLVAKIRKFSKTK